MGSSSASGTSRPGHPYHWNFVALERPLRPVTRPPDDMEKLYWPSSERLMVMGRRLEMRSRRPLEAVVSWSVVVIMPGRTRGARCGVCISDGRGDDAMRCGSEQAVSSGAVVSLWHCSKRCDAPGKDLKDRRAGYLGGEGDQGRQLRVSASPTGRVLRGWTQGARAEAGLSDSLYLDNDRMTACGRGTGVNTARWRGR